ncbi:MAG: glycosyltransferase family 4 protein [Lachnospiraceae bacterium]
MKIFMGSDNTNRGEVPAVVEQILSHKWSEDIDITYECMEMGNLHWILSWKRYLENCSTIRKGDFDIIYFHVADVSYLSEICKLVKKSKEYDKKIILHMHSTQWMEFYRNLLVDKEEKKEFKRCLELADRVIVIGESAMNFAKREFPDINVTVLHYGVKMPKDIDYTVQEKRVFVYSDEMIAYKGMGGLLESIEKLDDEHRNRMQFIAEGKGRDVDLMEAYCKLAYLEDTVQFVGKLSAKEKDELMKKASVAILPFYTEELPKSVLEGISYGLPVISTRVGSISEAVKEHENGWLVAGKDLENKEMVAALKMIIDEDEETLKKYSKKSRSLAEELFEERYFFEGLEKIFREVYEEKNN